MNNRSNKGLIVSRRIGELTLILGMVLPLNTFKTENTEICLSYIELIFKESHKISDNGLFFISFAILFLISALLLIQATLKVNEAGRLRSGLIFLLFGLFGIRYPGGFLVTLGGLTISLISFCQLLSSGIEQGIKNDTD
jgi:hypothetical protein